jgi:segregation and condensation protein B
MSENSVPPLPLNMRLEGRFSARLEQRFSARLEALLFVASGPVTNTQLAAALEIPVRAVDEALAELEAYYINGSGRALRLQRLHGRVQLTTAPEVGGLVERFLGLEATSRLSQAALEVLSIIAYRRPVTRPQIDAIRGVNSDGALKSLLNKGLVQEVGRSSSPGRPILYTITPEFLQHFGLGSLEELPPLESNQYSEGSIQSDADAQKDLLNTEN